MPWINPGDFVDTSEDEFVTLAELADGAQGYGRGRGRGRKKPKKKGKPATYSDLVSDPRTQSRRETAATGNVWTDSGATSWLDYSDYDDAATEQFWQDFAAGTLPPPSGSLGAPSPPAFQVLFGNPLRSRKKKTPKGR